MPDMKREILNLGLAVAALGLLGLAGKALAGDDAVVLEGCGPDGSCHKVCRPITETRNVPQRCYSSGCEDFCLPKCGLLDCFRGHKCCDQEGGCAGRCEHPRTRKYLIVKIRQKEECVPKCVVEQQVCPGQPPCLEPGPSALPPPPKKMAEAPHLLEQLMSDK
jgi:hypothetical protein